MLVAVAGGPRVQVGVAGGGGEEGAGHLLQLGELLEHLLAGHGQPPPLGGRARTRGLALDGLRVGGPQQHRRQQARTQRHRQLCNKIFFIRRENTTYFEKSI